MDNTVNEVELREQDRWLPIANVARLMKSTLPPTAKVLKDAKECMQECVSEFISFITSESSDKCLRDKRKTINGEDILYLMHDLGFENYAEVLKIYLAKYREQQALKQERGETRVLKRMQKQLRLDGPMDGPLELSLNKTATLSDEQSIESESRKHDETDHQLPQEPTEDDDDNNNQILYSALPNNKSATLNSPDLESISQFEESHQHNGNVIHGSNSPSSEMYAEFGNPDDDPKSKKDGYYDDFINADIQPDQHEGIHELSEHLTGNQQDIDSLAADMNDNGAGASYF